MPQQCIAITQKGSQCLKYQLHNNLLCSVHFKKKPTNVVWFNNVISYDDWFAQFNGNPVNQKENPNPIKTIIPKAVDKIRQFQCNCCMMNEFENPLEDLIGCSSVHKNDFCDHYICKDCLSRHIEIQIKTSIATLKCVFDDHDHCHGTYDIETIKSLLTWEDLSKYQEYLDLQLITELAAICEDYQICPLCKKFGCIVENNNACMDIPCGTCKQSWCSKCKEKEHGNTPCYSLNFHPDMKKEDMILKIDRVINELACETLTHSCVRCKNKFIKDEGCNLMTCEKCGSMSCYICSKELFKDANGNKYGHFAGHQGSLPGSLCPLWNNNAGDGNINQGNTEYNIKKVMNAMDELLRVNENKNIRFEIYNRIYENFRKETPKEIYKAQILKLGVKYNFVNEKQLSPNDRRLLLFNK